MPPADVHQQCIAVTGTIVDASTGDDEPEASRMRGGDTHGGGWTESECAFPESAERRNSER